MRLILITTNFYMQDYQKITSQSHHIHKNYFRQIKLGLDRLFWIAKMLTCSAWCVDNWKTSQNSVYQHIPSRKNFRISSLNFITYFEWITEQELIYFLWMVLFLQWWRPQVFEDTCGWETSNFGSVILSGSVVIKGRPTKPIFWAF